MIYLCGFLFTLAFVDAQEPDEKTWKVLLMALIWPISLGAMAGIFVKECSDIQKRLLRDREKEGE